MAKVKADLHNHLRTSSKFNDRDFNTAIDLASQRLGINGVIGLVNFADQRYEKFIELKGYERTYVGENRNAVYVPERKVLVVKGQEVPTREGHVLILGLKKDTHLKQNRSLNKTLREAKDLDGVVVVDHPFYSNGLGNHLELNREVLNDIDAIEVHNGEAAFGIPCTPLPYGANRKAQEFYKKVKIDFPHLGALASSDGHSMYELGRSWTEIEELDLETEARFGDLLRRSVINTDDQTPKCKKNGVFGAIDHIVDLAFIVGVAPRIGLRRLFETDKP